MLKDSRVFEKQPGGGEDAAKDKRNKRHAVSIPNVLGSVFPVWGAL
jgi:hypothetical protein